MRVVEYTRRCDPLATFQNLRAAGVLGGECYLHVHPDGAELGWDPAARLTLLDGELCPDWRARIGAFAEREAREGRSVFGYVAYDALGGSALVLPDGTATRRPLVALISPGEKLVFERDRVVHHTQSGRDVGAHLTSE